MAEQRNDPNQQTDRNEDSASDRFMEQGSDREQSFNQLRDRLGQEGQDRLDGGQRSDEQDGYDSLSLDESRGMEGQAQGLPRDGSRETGEGMELSPGEAMRGSGSDDYRAQSMNELDDETFGDGSGRLGEDQRLDDEMDL